MQFIFVFVCILAAVQSSAMHLVSANIRDTVMLHCFHEGNLALHLWFKKTLGDNPQWQRNKHLRISDMQLSDSATYYCGCSYSNKVDFGEGSILIHAVQPGDSVTLNCTIHTETCSGEQSVNWFRHGSGESHPGIIYTHGDRSDQCEKSPEEPSYYCAVASCGEIVFENGTKLDIKGRTDPLLLVYCLSSALGLLFVLIIVLGSIMYKMSKRKCLQCRGKYSPYQINE
uniref:Ig-like domain-containing protein n=1 Tax=Oncorhynchus kisutch TaxID=8019 RepID=A0A8C7JHG1_ONCKI